MPADVCPACSAATARAEVQKLVTMRRELVKTNALLQKEVALMQEAASTGEDARKQALEESVKMLLGSLDKLGKVTERLSEKLEKAAALDQKAKKAGAAMLGIKDREKLRTFAKDFKAVKAEGEKLYFLIDRWIKYRDKQDPRVFLQDAEGLFERSAGAVFGLLTHAETSKLALFDDPEFLWDLVEVIGGPGVASARYSVSYTAAAYTFFTSWEQLEAHDRNVNGYLLGLKTQAASLCRQQKVVNQALEALHACTLKECPARVTAQPAVSRDLVCPEIDPAAIRARARAP
jgi:hypothetical protein